MFERRSLRSGRIVVKGHALLRTEHLAASTSPIDAPALDSKGYIRGTKTRTFWGFECSKVSG